MNQQNFSRRVSCKPPKFVTQYGYNTYRRQQQSNTPSPSKLIQQSPKEQIQYEQCIIYPIDAFLNKKSVICPRCQITLCYFCQTESCHSTHMSGKIIYSQKGALCQCNDNSHHSTQQFRLFILKCYKVNVVQYKLSAEIECNNSLIKGYNSTLNKIEKMRKHQVLVQFLNYIFENQAIYKALFQPFKRHIQELQEILEGGDPDDNFYYQTSSDMQNKSLNEKILECFAPNIFDYNFVLTNLKILKIVNGNLKIQKRFLILSQNLKSSFNFEFFCFIISKIILIIKEHYAQISQSLPDDYTKEKLQQIIKLALDGQELQLKEEFSHYRKIETKSIENSSLLSRLSLQDYNINQRQIRKLRAPVLIHQLLKNLLNILLQLDVDQFQKSILVHFLKIYKLVLKTREIYKVKSIAKTLKQLITLFKNISYHHQQINNTKQNDMDDSVIDSQIFTLLSDVLVQIFYVLKDDQFLKSLTKIQNTKYLFQLSKLFSQPEETQLQFLTHVFDTKKDDFQNIYNILISILINQVLETKMMSSSKGYKKTLNLNIVNLLSEQLLSKSFYANQIQYLSENEISLFYLQKTLLKKDLVQEYDFDQLDEKKDHFQYQSQQFKEFEQFMKYQCRIISTMLDDVQYSKQDIYKINQVLGDILTSPFCLRIARYTSNKQDTQQKFQKFIIFSKSKEETPILQSSTQASIVFEKKDTLLHPETTSIREVKQFQLILYLSGLDQLLFRVLFYKDYIFDFEQSALNSMNPYYHAITFKIYHLLYLYTFNNRMNFCQLMQKNNLKIFTTLLLIQPKKDLNTVQVTCQTQTNMQISFYYRIIMNQFVKSQSKQFSSPLLQNRLIIEHIQRIFLMIHMQYTDVSELSVPHAFDTNLNQAQLIEILNIILSQLSAESDQHQSTDSLIEYIFLNLLPDILNHLKEIFLDPKQQDFSDASEMEYIVHQRQKINRFAKINLFQSLDEIKEIKKELMKNQQAHQQQDASFNKEQSMNQNLFIPLMEDSLREDYYITIHLFRQLFIYKKDEELKVSYQIKLPISTFMLTNEFLTLVNIILEYQNRRQLIDLSHQNEKIQCVEQQLVELVEVLYENQSELFNKLLDIIDLRMELNKFLTLMFERKLKETLFQQQNNLKEKERDPLFQQEEDQNDNIIILHRQIIEQSNLNFDNFSALPITDRYKEEDEFQTGHGAFLLKSPAKIQSLLYYNLEHFDTITQIIYDNDNLDQNIKSLLTQNYIKDNIIFPFESLVNLYKITSIYQLTDQMKIDLLQMLDIMENVQLQKKCMIDIISNNFMSQSSFLRQQKTTAAMKNEIILTQTQTRKWFFKKGFSTNKSKTPKCGIIKIEEIIQKYELDFSKDLQYRKLIKLSKTSCKDNENQLLKNSNQKRQNYQLNNLSNLIKKTDSLNLENIDKQGLLILLIRDFRSKNTDHIGNTLVNYFINILQSNFNESSIAPFSLQQYSYKIFTQQTDIVKLVMKLMIIETKKLQLLFRQNIENNPQKFMQFKEKLNKTLIFLSSVILPQLCQNVINFEVIYHLNKIEQSQSAILMHVFSYNFLDILQRDKMNTCRFIWARFEVQIYHKIGLLENLMQLFVDVIKSKHITDMFQKINEDGDQRNEINTRIKKDPSNQKKFQSIQQTRLKLFTFFMIKQRLKSLRTSNSKDRSDIQSRNDNYQVDNYKMSNTKIFLKLFAHIVTAIAEMNQGNCGQNQIITFDYLNKHRVWPVIIKILTIKAKNTQQHSIYTLRTYIFQLILSLMEDAEKNSDDFLYIMKLLNHKILEETLNQTFRRLIYINGLAQENADQFENMSKISLNLTLLYKMSLGDDLNESLVFDKKILIKILFQIYKLLNLYATVNPEVQEYLQYFKENTGGLDRLGDDAVNIAIFKFIFSIVGNIEYVNHNNVIEKFHFFFPPMSFFLSSETKLQFLSQRIDRSNPSSKISSVIDVVPEFMIEMEENMTKYRKSKFYSHLITISVSNFHHKQFSKFLVMLNFITLILISNNHYVELSPKMDNHSQRQLTFKISHPLIVYMSEFLLTLFSLAALLCQLFFRMSIYYKLVKSKKTSNYMDKLLHIYEVFSKEDIFQFTLHFVLSLLGMIIDPFFFYLQSFCFIYISKTMYSVLEALKLRWVQFIGIFIFIMIILNLYSYIGFIKFTTSFQLQVTIQVEEDITEEEILCDSPIHCFLSLVYLGLRDGAGLGAYGDNESYYKSSDYYPRLLFDFSFFLIVTLIMLNIVYGIIIDTFADLRDQESSIEHDMKNVCLICSVERWQFDKKGIDFTKHIEGTHRVWSYTSFLIHLNIIGKENMNGIETYIFTKIKAKDLSWIPQGRTKLLET